MAENENIPRAGKRRLGPWAVVLVLGVAALYVLSGRRGAPPEGWLTDLDRARQEAAETHKLVFVEFGAVWCPSCRMMKREVFPDPRVREALEDYVSVHIDVDGQPDTARQHAVYAVPTLIVMDPKGAVLAKWDGGMPVDQLLQRRSAPGLNNAPFV